ncbi:bacillithiol biosynthesis deacetylase BshB1 [Mesoterricola sediminis]|uniref:Bacillithiol biosynthesis deacetylase BshB1 n=1 Tax=Mesoterricola sediminis TaxID=2927980 RepID=A0AA48GS52_9BACT|nr:bacillithiol biosynthesis deacetylase BshB1 [Mesoterricola sediminis]BDU76587.1 bacillithiol biosynthesis deacetylase BshB1 [Mesoterricola sediminis]
MSGLDLLVVGAHPDDAEVHVGGILALAADRGLEAGILDLTRGEMGTRGDAATRHAEAMEAARILGVARRILDLPDARFDESEASRAQVAVQLRELRPAVVVLPDPEDRHPDHRRAHRLVREAAYYAGLRNLPIPGEPWRPQAVAWVGGENPGRPDLLVDVSAVWARRMAAFDAFGSQFQADPAQPPTRISDPAFRRGVEGRAMHWGSLIRVPWAEALWTERPVPPALAALLGRLA